MSKHLNIHDGTGIIAKDPNQGILLAYGSTVPAANTIGFAFGCKFIRTSGTTIGTTEYVNIGTKAAANFVQTAQNGLVVASLVWDATITDRTFFTAPSNMAFTILSVVARVTVAGTGGACTAQIRRPASGTAISSGAGVHSGTINLVGTVDTNQAMTITSPNLTAGQSLAFDLTGTPTSAVGSVSVFMVPA